MNIILTNNQGYKWVSEENIHFKGYILDLDQNRVLRGCEAISVLNTFHNYEELIQWVKRIDGLFSFVINRDDETWLCVDVARSMPLFYSVDKDIVSDSVERIVEVKGYTQKDLEISAVEEFIRTYYIGHERTLYKGIKQVDAGQIAYVNRKEVKTEYYYVHRSDIEECTREEAIERFNKMSVENYKDLLKVIDGRPIAISLSGGYDSRYVACMLKEVGATDVSCYSYGKGETFEVKKARQIAENLGFRWTFVNYTDSLMKDYFSGEYIDFFDCYEGRDSVPYIQNYAAVCYLDKMKWFKPNTVFVTGLCNDMQSGAYTKQQEEVVGFEPSIHFLVNHIIERRNMNNCLGKKALAKYKEVLYDTIKKMGVNVSNYQEFVSATESIEAILMHSRVFLHMNDVHAQKGYEWLLPCWTKKSLSYWYSLPAEYRYNQNLYEEWQLTSIPAKYSVAEKKVRTSYTLYTGIEKTKARIRLLLKRLVLYPMGLSINEAIDYNNFNYVSARYFQKISEKYVLGFKNLSTNHVLCLYVAEKWLGNDIYRNVVEKYEKE